MTSLQSNLAVIHRLDQEITVDNPKGIQRIELLKCIIASGQELVGLAVELAEDPNGGVQMRFLMDANIVSGVIFVPLQHVGFGD
jgi:hypothetical protein